MPLVTPLFYSDGSPTGNADGKAAKYKAFMGSKSTENETQNKWTPRVLNFSADSDDEFDCVGLPLTPLRDRNSAEELSGNEENACNSRYCDENRAPCPPQDRLRSLRLFDSPRTPKSLLLSVTNSSEQGNIPCPSTWQRRTKPSCDSAHRSAAGGSTPETNYNPFTREAVLQSVTRRKRDRRDSLNSSLESDDDESSQLPKRIHLQDIQESRYEMEFVTVREIGSGKFGVVLEAINRLDGCRYAVKRSLLPVAGSANETRAMREVYAHAVLGHHPHVVRYYSAWAEDGRMLIQNELCAGGSLERRILSDGPLREAGLRRLTEHVNEGLRYVHTQGLVHLDIKPANIFISFLRVSPIFSAEDQPELPVYKIGDLGHVTCVTTPADLEEGDCRYLAQEVLRDDEPLLDRVDMFALGLTVFEAGGGGPLPCNGEYWRRLRDDGWRELSLSHCGDSFNQLLRSLLHTEPTRRPSSSALSEHPCLGASRTRVSQLVEELESERVRNRLLSSQLKEAQTELHSVKRVKVVGRKLVRCASIC